MAYTDGSYSCNEGLPLIAQALAGELTLTYCRVALGTGGLDGSPKEATEVAGYVLDGTVVSATTPEDGQCQVTVQVSSEDVEEAFYCGGVMLYAQDADGNEVPFTYLYLEENPVYIRDQSSTITKITAFNLICIVGSVDTVAVSLSDSDYITYGQATALIEESEAATANTISETETAIFANVAEQIEEASDALTANLVSRASANIGGTAKPVYVLNGAATAVNATVGGTATPVYMNAGTVTALSATVGSGTKLIYLNAGAVTNSSSTVGAAARPVYLSNGTVTQCVQNNMTAIGYGAVANASCATAYGNNAVASGTDSIALGYGATVSAGATGSVAIGTDAFVSVNAPHGLAVGAEANAAGHGVALGYLANAPKGGAMALGTYACAAACSAMAFGYNAVCGSNTPNSIAIGAAATIEANNDCTVVIGRNAYSGDLCYDSVAIGRNASANARYTTALGYSANASGNCATALGYSASCANANGMQLGSASGLSSLTCKVSLTTTSDIRDKTDVEEITDGATAFLKALTAIRYVYNGRIMYIPEEEDRTDDDRENLAKYGLCAYDTEAWEAGTKKGTRRRVGISAQEIQAALASAFGDESYVNLVNDNLYDFDEVPEDVESQLSVNYEGFVPLLIKGFQELEARVAALEGAE